MLSLRPLASTALRASVRPLAIRSVARSVYTPFRAVATQPTSQAEGLEILKKQRANRPVSPHLQIYEMQLTMVLSGLNRITGVAMAFPLYAFLVGYAGLPLLGVEFTSDMLMSWFGALPLIAKLPIKFFASLPFTFHSLNGIRHLVWDTTKELTLKGVYRTGWIVTGLTVLSSAVLTFL